MFKNILQFFKGKDFLNQVLEDFKAMLDDAEEMYQCVCKKLIHNEDSPGLKDKIYSIDKNINEREKDIRKRIVEHLAIQPSVNIPTSLLLMSVVKDAERLGDYSKNLYEVTTLLTNPIDPNTFKNLFGNIDNEILDFFKQTKDASVTGMALPGSVITFPATVGISSTVPDPLSVLAIVQPPQVSSHEQIDLVLLDMIMPVLGGREAFHKFREIKSNCKVLISSGFTKDQDLKGID